ncbi:exodeoxyribonuclease-3 [Barrientosiimonas humi]|uniref:Exodeoxyribonuclease-3 n=1 Tax=Barrientosiimonas humi TaxID=999931 RepID=A0A542XE90_9MICO|nr:exodeoxyribonuclease III [Barrientosiimonas humi]TQL34139.1 exodeoxyribonuclease-3 [Barrientosiimonas humi]CAG7574129.1 Exodeoxyribonuclease [Barrientosiimonas humi]
MLLITANVNGIRAAARRGGLAWLAAQEPDVLSLQEVRATRDQLESALAGTPFADWHLAYAEGVSGRAGVAVLSRGPIARTAVDLPVAQGQGRWIEAEVQVPGGPALTVLSAYVHTGEAGTPVQEEKFALLDAIGGRLEELRDQHVVLTGDLNVCHTARDLKNWKGNRGKAGFLPEEQERLTGWAERGWVDLGRRQAGDVDGPYTWWSWRGKAFDNDAGWRIDYAIASPPLAERPVEVVVGRAPTYAERWSDHAPLVVRWS